MMQEFFFFLCKSELKTTKKTKSLANDNFKDDLELSY